MIEGGRGSRMTRAREHVPLLKEKSFATLRAPRLSQGCSVYSRGGPISPPTPPPPPLKSKARP